MPALKNMPLPAILVANDLLDGDVLFRAADGWTPDPRAAAIARDDEAAQALERAGAAATARQEVVDAYLIDVDIRTDGAPVPRHFRERFKTLGPSVRPDLGKQAEFAGYARAAAE